jgi:hypothetical protein
VSVASDRHERRRDYGQYDFGVEVWFHVREIRTVHLREHETTSPERDRPASHPVR